MTRRHRSWHLWLWLALVPLLLLVCSLSLIWRRETFP
jgi:hypothetical protein